VGVLADIQRRSRNQNVFSTRRPRRGRKLPDMCLLVAANDKSNVRRIGGTLIKLIAYSLCPGNAIHLQMAQQVLSMVMCGPESDQRFIQNSSLAEHLQVKQSAAKERAPQEWSPAPSGHVPGQGIGTDVHFRRSAGAVRRKAPHTVIHSVNKNRSKHVHIESGLNSSSTIYVTHTMNFVVFSTSTLNRL